MLGPRPPRSKTLTPRPRACAAWLVLVLLALAPRPGFADYQGFGTTTPGGEAGAVVHVTNLNDSGPGSFREAVAAGNRTVVFDVAGEILLTDYVSVRGAFVTIDGFSAPPPGITLRNRGLVIRGSRGAHDVIVRGFRVRGSPIDGIQVSYGAYNVVLDHVSVAGSGDGNVDITDSHDVTVSWSILAGNEKNMLVKYNPSRVTLHHNLFTESVTRSPQVRIDDTETSSASDTTADIRNNVVWGWGNGYGTIVWYGPRANVVANYYETADDAISVTSARAYVDGNVSGDGIDIDGAGNESSPFPAPMVDTQDACAAASLVLADAGVRPLDSVDADYLSRVNLVSCAVRAPEIGVSPASLAFAATAGGPPPAPQNLAVTNVGAGTLLWTARSDSPWLSVSPTSGTAPRTLTVTVNPVGLAAGSYRGLVIVESGQAVDPSVAVPVDLVVSGAAKDLVIVGLTGTPASVVAGGSVTVSYQVKNQGTVTVTETYTDKIYLSTDAKVDTPGDVLLGTSHGHTSDLAPNATHAHSQTVTIPTGTPAGSYSLLVQADALGAVIETNEGNNVTAIPLTVTASSKDLVIVGLGLSASSVARGGSVTASYQVKNQGTVTVTETYTDRIYLSPDATLSANDAVLGTSHGHTSALAPNATHSHSQSVTIPAATPPGSYFLLVQADGLAAVSEANEGNNVTVIPLSVTGP